MEVLLKIMGEMTGRVAVAFSRGRKFAVVAKLASLEIVV